MATDTTDATDATDTTDTTAKAKTQNNTHKLYEMK